MDPHTEPLKIWTNFRLPEEQMSLFRQRVAPHELLVATKPNPSSLTPTGPDPLLARCDVAFGQPDPAQVINLPNVRWVQLSSAGYTRYDRNDFRQALRGRGAMLSNASSVFDDPCAQHVLAMMLALARQLPSALENQRTTRSWPGGPVRRASRLLGGQSALLVGFGAIARRFSQLLAPFRMEITGVRRSIKGDEPVPTVELDKLDDLLPQADHVVDLLPSSSSTKHFFNADRVARMKHTAVFYNIGRGDTVDQYALRTALETGSIAAAYLDVTSPEPLPPDDPLWTTPNCYITPHSAGGHQDEQQRQVEHFLNNLRRFERGEELIDRIV